MQRYESYKPSKVEWLGDIPESWDVRRNIGLFDERKEVNQPEMELLSVTINRGVIKQEEITEKKDSSNEDKSKYKVVQKDDLAYNKMRMWQGAIGRSAYEGIVSPAYVILCPRDKLYSRYYHYLYRTEAFIAEANRHSYGLCLDMNSLRYEDFKTIYSPVPPHSEVERIVAFLDQKTAEIDAAIAKKERLIELLQEQKSVLITQSVTRGFGHNMQMRYSGINWIGQVPEPWVLSSIGLFARVSNGSTPSRDNSSYWTDGTIPWLSSGSVNDYYIYEPSEYITERAYKNTSLRLYHPGTVVIGIVGQGKTRGTSALMHISACINQNMAAIEPNSKIDSEFLHLYLVGCYDQIRGGGQGSNQEALNCDSVKKFPLLIPPISEQRSIVSHVNRESKKIDSSIRIASTQIDRLQELRRILVAEVAAGKIKI